MNFYDYTTVGHITSFSEIPWGEPVIVSGSIGRDTWVQRMPGVFEKKNGGHRFRDDYGMITAIDEKSFIAISILEKVRVDA